MEFLFKLIENATTVQIVGVSLVTFIAVWAVKTTDLIDNRYLPLLSIFIGIVCGFSLSFFFGEPGKSIIYGIASAAMASGFYDVLKTFIRHVSEKDNYKGDEEATRSRALEKEDK